MSMDRRCWVCRRRFDEAYEDFLKLIKESNGEDFPDFGGSLILPIEISEDGGPDRVKDIEIPLCGVCYTIFSKPCKVIRKEFSFGQGMGHG
jgi:hypothetical protein